MADDQTLQPPVACSTTFFAGASNVRFSGNTNFHVGDVHVLQEAARRDPIEFLLQYCAPDALVDSKERYDAPRCSPETRDGIQEEIIHWINSPDGLSAVFWLFGSAGAGKSAICQTIAEIFKREGLLLGNFFFSRGAGSAGRSNGDRLIPTLLYQLSQALPETRSHIKRVIRQNPLIMNAQRSTQMSDLYVASLNASPMKNFFRRLNWGKRVRLVVIDGWDECQNPDIQCDLLRIIAESAKALHLPVRFLIASRPESHLEHTFLHDPSFQDVKLSTMNLDADQHAYRSICTFLHAEFHSIQETHPLRQSLPPSWPSEAAVQILASKSSPQFVYAATVMRYVGDPNADDPPDVRLATIFTVSDPASLLEDSERPLENIDRLYRFIFNGVKPRHRDQVWCLLGIIHLASQLQHAVPAASLRFFSRLFRQGQGNLRSSLRPLASVLEIPTDASKPIRSLHASLFDFLLDPRRSESLCLDLQQSYERLFSFHWDNIGNRHYSKNGIDEVTRRLFDGVKTHHRERVWCVLGLLRLASRRPHSAPTTSPGFFEDLLSTESGHLYTMLLPLKVMIDVPLDASKPIQLLYPFLFDFLLDPDRSGNLSLDFQQSYGRLLELHLHRENLGDHYQVVSVDELTACVLDGVNPHHREQVWGLLGILCLASWKPSVVPFTSLQFFEDLFDLEPGDLHYMLQPLASIIDVPMIASGPVEVLHPQLLNFLLDSSRSGEHSLNLQQLYGTLLTFYLHNKAPNYNISVVDTDDLTRDLLYGVDPQHREQVWCLLGILHLAGQRQYAVPTTSPGFFEHLFNVTRGHLQSMLSPLASVINIPINGSRPIQSPHASIFAFLLDPRRSGDLALSLQPSYRKLLEFHLRNIREDETSAIRPTTGIVNLITQIFHSDSKNALKVVTSQLSRFEEHLMSTRHHIEPISRVAVMVEMYTKISDAALHHFGHAQLLANRYTFYREKKLGNDLIKDALNPFSTEACSLKHFICLNMVPTQTPPLDREKAYMRDFLHYFAATIAQDLQEINPTLSTRLKKDIDIIHDLGRKLLKKPLEVDGGDLVLGCRKLVLQYFDPTRIPPNPECDVFKVWSDILVEEYQAWVDAQQLKTAGPKVEAKQAAAQPP